MNLRANLWLKTAYARAWVRTMSMYGDHSGHSKQSASTVLHDGNEPTLLHAGATARIGFAILGGIMLLVLGQRSMVDGEPVQLGQASRPIRDIHHIPRSDKRDTRRHVAGWHTRTCPFCQ